MRALVLGLVATVATFGSGGCASAPKPYPPIVEDCSKARIGKVTVLGATPGEVAPLAVLEGTLDEPERTARITAVATELLHVRGYPYATIDVTRRDGCGVELAVAVERGARFRIDKLGFATDDAFPDAERAAAVEDALGTVNTVGGSYVAERMQRALAALERRYHDAGWLDAEIGSAHADFDSDRGTVTVVVPIRAGRRYRIGTVVAHGGGDAELRAEVVAALGLQGGEWYDATRVRTGIERARKRLDRRIELHVEVVGKHTIDLEAVVQPR